MSSLISSLAWVRRGVAARHPNKYILDDKELERVSALARIELEDARTELERAHEAAQMMGKGAEGEEADDAGDDAEENWVEYVVMICCCAVCNMCIVKTREMPRMLWMWTRKRPSRQMISLSTNWMSTMRRQHHYVSRGTRSDPSIAHTTQHPVPSATSRA